MISCSSAKNPMSFSAFASYQCFDSVHLRSSSSQRVLIRDFWPVLILNLNIVFACQEWVVCIDTASIEKRYIVLRGGGRAVDYEAVCIISKTYIPPRRKQHFQCTSCAHFFGRSPASPEGIWCSLLATAPTKSTRCDLLSTACNGRNRSRLIVPIEPGGNGIDPAQ